MGGALTFLAAEYAAIDAAAPFYGTPPAELGHVGGCFACHSGLSYILMVDDFKIDAAILLTPHVVYSQPDKIKVPVQAHVGENDAFEVCTCR